MSKPVYRLYTPGCHPTTGVQHWINFECDCASIGSLVSALNEGVLVAGNQLVTAPTLERGVFEVTGRYPMAIRRDGIARIELPTGHLVEFEGAAS